MSTAQTSDFSQIILKRTDSNNADFRHLIKLLDKNLNEINGEIQADYDQHNIIEDIDTVIIAYCDKAPAGCSCFKQFDDNTVEIKRMYVDKPYRQKGIAFKVLNELEQWARELGYTYALLETGTRHHEALALYHKMGYIIIPNYQPYVDMPDSVCMRKKLDD
jgi:putative acetyltransferase